MPRTVEVPEYAIASEVTIHPERTALVVVDMQEDFVRPDGALPVPGAAATVEPVGRLVAWARGRGMAIFFTQDTHFPGDPEWAIWGRHVEHGTDGWRIVPELAPRSPAEVVAKTRYDAFYGTGLDHELRRRGIDTLVICGTVANICVHYTAASAGLRWYRIVHPVDALSALTPFDLEAALRQASFLFQAELTTTEALLASGGPG